MKVSNELLSSVLGCECEFVEIKHNKIFFKSENHDKFNNNFDYILWDVAVKITENSHINVYLVNLDTFIRMTKIWIYRNTPFEVLESATSIGITKQACLINEFEKTYEKNDSYSVHRVLKALEWCLNDCKN